MTDMTFESAISAFFEQKMRGLFTAIPAVIMQVNDAEKQIVDVKPLVNEVFPDWTDDQEYPTILSVPLIFPSSSTSAITFPVKAGDTVLLVFAQSCIDVFKSGDGTAQPPSDYRRFNKRDAIAIPGLWPFGNAVNQPTKHTLPHSTEDVVVFHNLGTSSECELRMKQSGKIEITSPLQVEVKAPLVNVTATTSATISAPAIYATASTLATITAPIATVTATTSATISAPAIYATASTLATITAPIATVSAATSAAITSPLISLAGTTSVAVASPLFTWNGSTVATV
jgi:phage gp45-like